MQFARERRGRHGFPRAGRPEKEKFAPRAQAVFAQPLLLPLFEKHALQPLGQSLGQSHVAETDRGSLDGEQICQFAARLENHELPGPALNRRRAPLGFIDQVAQLLRDGNVAQPRLVSGRLHGDGQNLFVVAFEVALQQGDHVASRAHKFSSSIPRWSHGASARSCRTLRYRSVVSIDSCPSES
jgi:hypothetical protein